MLGLDTTATILTSHPHPMLERGLQLQGFVIVIPCMGDSMVHKNDFDSLSVSIHIYNLHR